MTTQMPETRDRLGTRNHWCEDQGASKWQ